MSFDARFWIPGPPVPWHPDARGHIRDRRDGTKFARGQIIIPREVRVYEALVARLAFEAGVPANYTDAVAVRVWLCWSQGVMPPRYYTQTPDADKVLRTICDGLGQVMGDDRHIAHQSISKIRCAVKEPAAFCWVQSTDSTDVARELLRLASATDETNQAGPQNDPA